MIINKKDLIKILEEKIDKIDKNSALSENETIVAIEVIDEIIIDVNSMEYNTTWDEIFRHLDDDDIRRAIYALDKKRKERESRPKIEIYLAEVAKNRELYKKYFMTHKEAWGYIVEKMSDGCLVELDTVIIFEDELGGLCKMIIDYKEVIKLITEENKKDIKTQRAINALKACCNYHCELIAELGLSCNKLAEEFLFNEFDSETWLENYGKSIIYVTQAIIDIRGITEINEETCDIISNDLLYNIDQFINIKELG